MKRIFILAFLFILTAVLSSTALAAEQTCAQECEDKVCVMYFYSPTCHACQSIADFISEINETYSENITLHKLDVNEPENFDKYSSFCAIKELSMESRGIPLVVTKDSFLMGTADIKSGLEDSIKRLIENNEKGCINPDVCHGENGNKQQAVITLPLILAAAAADSINPCAIGVLIFLIGFLLISSGKNYRRTAQIAAIYIITVYIVYFLAGIGILEALSKLTFLNIVTKAFGVGVAFLGLINIKDAIQNKPAGTLAIPTKAKPLIEKWVYRASPPAAVILGIIVASVELPCTGGMYLAILTLMANTVTRSTAITYLLIYNLIFVMPLIIITFLFVRGFEAEKLQNYLERHKRKSRMIMGITLLITGAVLFFL